MLALDLDYICTGELECPCSLCDVSPVEVPPPPVTVPFVSGLFTGFTIGMLLASLILSII